MLLCVLPHLQLVLKPRNVVQAAAALVLPSVLLLSAAADRGALPRFHRATPPAHPTASTLLCTGLQATLLTCCCSWCTSTCCGCCRELGVLLPAAAADLQLNRSTAPLLLWPTARMGWLQFQDRSCRGGVSCCNSCQGPGSLHPASSSSKVSARVGRPKVLMVPTARVGAPYLASIALLPAVSSAAGSCIQPGSWHAAPAAWLLPSLEPAAWGHGVG